MWNMKDYGIESILKKMISKHLKFNVNITQTSCGYLPFKNLYLYRELGHKIVKTYLYGCHFNILYTVLVKSLERLDLFKHFINLSCIVSSYHLNNNI